MVIKNRNRILLVRGIHKFVLADGGLHGKLSQLNPLLKVCRRCDRTVLVGDRVADTFTKETSVESLRSCWLRRTGGSRDRNELCNDQLIDFYDLQVHFVHFALVGYGELRF